MPMVLPCNIRPSVLYSVSIKKYPEVSFFPTHILEKARLSFEGPPLWINMNTRDQFSLDHTSYPSLDASPQYPSGYLPIVEYRFLQTDVQNYDLFYEQPPSAPFLAEPPEPPPSSISSPPKYRTIQPRPSATSPDAKTPGDTLQIKPGKRQWRPQDTSGESTSVQLEAGVKRLLS